MQEFTPARWLSNPHCMTVAAAFWRRKFPGLPPGKARAFEVESGSKVLAHCHWQAAARATATLLLVHGLEGSSESGYILGTAEKAYRAGFNVVRMNQRNCGGSESLTPTLYNSGLSGDVRAVILTLVRQERLEEIFAAGFSMGGNLVLKMAGEFAGEAPPELRGTVAVCPAIDLAACADAVGHAKNRIYQWHFVRNLKKRMRQKARQHADRYPLASIDFRRVRSVRQFDERITARFCGFTGADDYYTRASALPLMEQIAVPTLLIAAQDDPMIPFVSFQHPGIRGNSQVTLEAPEHGGHCGFLAASRNGQDRFWAEARIVEFCRSHSRWLGGRGAEAPF